VQRPEDASHLIGNGRPETAQPSRDMNVRGRRARLATSPASRNHQGLAQEAELFVAIGIGSLAHVRALLSAASTIRVRRSYATMRHPYRSNHATPR
jgi:hypothetical protein